MVWDLPGQDSGQTRWIKPRYSTAKNVVPVALQEKDPESLLSHYRKLIALRKAHPDLATGSIAGLDNFNKGLCAYVIRGAGEEILVIHNLTENTAVLDARQFKLKEQAFFLEGEYSTNGKTLHLDPFGSLIQLVAL
jgi:glycosidase